MTNRPISPEVAADQIFAAERRSAGVAWYAAFHDRAYLGFCNKFGKLCFVGRSKPKGFKIIERMKGT